MPGFTTHYLFGLNSYKQLPHILLKQVIQKNHAAYSLGLQGPDIFFYFLPSYTIHANNIGSIAHTDHTGLFLQHLLESRKLFPERREQQTADAYIAGFLGHYTLDTHCHPYVYWKTGVADSTDKSCWKKSSRIHGRHISLEVDIDTELLQFYKHRIPSSFRQNSTLLLTRPQLHTIATILRYVYQQTYPELGIWYTTMWAAVRSMQFGTKWLRDPSGRKKKYIGGLEKIVLGHPLLSSLIPSDNLTVHIDPMNILHRPWRNPWDPDRVFTDSFFDLMEQAQINYVDILTDLNRLFQTCSHGPKEQPRTQALLHKLGNASYHSGLDSNLPS